MKKEFIHSERVIPFGVDSVLNWNYKIPNQNFYYLTQMEWNRTLLTKINEASVYLCQKSAKLSDISIVVSPVALAILDDMEFYVSISSDSSGAIGVLGRYNVFFDYNGFVKSGLITKRMLLLESKKQYSFSNDFVLVFDNKSSHSLLINIYGAY